MLRRAAALFFSLVALTAGSLASAQVLDEARALARSGEYEAALATLELPDSTDEVVPARILRGQLLLEVGRHEEAEELLEPIATGRRARAEAMVTYAMVLAARGHPGRAIGILSDALERDPELLRAQHERARLRAQLGQVTRSRADYEAIVEAFRAGRLTAAPDVAVAASAFHGLGLYQEANAAYALAVEVDPGSVEARLGWALLLLEKYRPDQARELTAEVLAINPNHPLAQVYYARAGLEVDLSPDEVRRMARRALETNPRLPEAYELLAELALSEEAYGEAIELLRPVRRFNPTRLETLTLAGAAYYLLDQRREYRAVAAQVLELNSGYATFYVVVGEFASHASRYQAALDLYRRALEIDPDDWRANIGMGIGLSRHGDDEGGATYLRRALELDPFNVRAYHMVRLYEETLDDYEVVLRGHFRFRFHRSERAVLEDYVAEILEQAWTHFVDVYGVELESPIAVEIFAQPETFAIRSVGLPHVAPHGICFGRLITARSPNTGDFNWAEVLVHELSHAFTLEVSDERIPRWLSEGIAEYDTSTLRPEWQREGGLLMLGRLQSDSLFSVSNLNAAFLRTDNLDDIQTAYAQSALIVQFLVDRWGREGLLALVHAFADRQSLGQALERTTGMDATAFDLAFEAYLRDRLSGLLDTFEPNLAHPRDAHALEVHLASRPDDADAWAELAIAYYQAGHLDDCQRAWQRAVELEPNHPTANFVAGSLALRERRLDEARGLLEGILESGHDGYSLRNQLGRLARRQGRSSQALEHHRAAQAIFPGGVETYQAMADIHLRAGQQDLAIDELRQLVRIDQNAYEPVVQLLELLLANDRPADAWEACVMANYINPFDAARHGTCGRLALRLGDPEAARRELEVELALGAADPTGSRALLDQLVLERQDVVAP